MLPLLAGLLALYLAAPFLAGLMHLGIADWRGASWQGLGQATLISVLSASTATALIALGGIPLGFLLARGRPGANGPARRGPARRGDFARALLGFCVQLPLALPPLSSGILLLFLLGYASPLGALTHGALTDSFAGIVLAETFVAAPFLIIAARSAFAAVDPVLEDVARTLGHGPGRVFFGTALPLAWRGIAAGMLLAWLRAFGEFGATVMVAYHPYSLPIYTYVAFGAGGLPAMVPVLVPTLGAALLVMLAASRLTAPARLPQHSPLPQEAAGQSGLRPAPPRPALPRPAPRGLSLGITRQAGGFTLSLQHSTAARRIALLGASGSGKSLTLRAITGLDRAAGDRLLFGEADLAALPPEARHIAYVPQSYGLFPHLGAFRQLGRAPDHDPAAARFWFTRLGLAGLEHRRPEALSLGQQQRVALARALCRPAGLLLLDEPFAALDAPLRAELRQSLRALQEETAMTTILVTHDPEEAFLLADEILVLRGGALVQAGAAQALFTRPRDAAVARLLGAGEASAGRAIAPALLDIGGGITLAVSGPPLTPGGRYGWSIAPAHLRLLAEGGLPATILSVSPAAGGRQRALIRIGDIGGAERLLEQAPEERLAPGPARVAIPPGSLQIWPEGAAAETGRG